MTSNDMRQIRDDMGLSQQAMAELINGDHQGGRAMTGRTVRRYESGDLPIPNVVAFAYRALSEGYVPGKKKRKVS